MKINRNLAVIALVLLVLSIWAYRSSVVSSERFERGQTFLPNLNPDEIASIEIAKGDDRVALKRGEEEFKVTTTHGYPAKNEAVNRLIRNLLEISLEKEIGSGEELNEELDLVEVGDSTTEVVLKNEADQQMVHFLIGKNMEGGSGSYVRRLDGEEDLIHLTTSNLYINSDAKTYLKRTIIDVKADQIKSIRGRDFLVTAEDEGELELAGVRAGWEESSTGMNKVKNLLSNLSFDEVFLGDDSQVAGLSFVQRLRIDLKDTSGYELSLAERGGDAYLRISGFHPIDRVMVNRDETDEELQEKADMLSRASEINEFNTFHGSWVYKISEATADKIKIQKSELMQEKSS
jgi:hypothetical protein